MTSPSLFIRLLKFFMSWVAQVEVIGTEHLRSSKGRIVVSNHVGWADPLWLGYAAYPVFLRQMAKRELFVNPVTRWFVSSGGGFPVDRNHTSPATIKHTITLLQRGENVLIFPEGTRARGDNQVKRGAATIALHAQVDIIPAHYEGPTAISPRHLFRRPRIRIVFGEPLSVQPYDGVDKSVALQLTGRINQALKSIASASQ